jgi:hypothetical protein
MISVTKYSFVEADTRGRVALGRWLQPGRQYMVETDSDSGIVTLEPVGLVLSDEAASDLVENPERVAALLTRARKFASGAAPGRAVAVDDIFENL